VTSYFSVNAAQRPLSAELLLGSEEAARELGVDLAPLLRETGISYEQIRTGSGYLTLRDVVYFLNEGAKRFDCEDFGLLIASHQPPVRFAMLSRLLRYCATLEQAITDGIQYSILNSTYSNWTVERHGDLALLIRRTRTGYDAPLGQLQTLAMVLVYKAINALCQSSVKLTQVQFSHAKVGSKSKLEKVFGAPVSFDQQFNALVLSNKVLAAPIPTRDERLHKVIAAQLAELVAQNENENSLRAKIRLYVLSTLGSARCNLRSFCHENEINPRALQRLLAKEGASFKLLQAQVRYELARDYLRNSKMSILELADLLGYSNPSAFTRAFKQRAGISPWQWRRANSDLYLPPALMSSNDKLTRKS
jgi:AraC-like DNA-binding protein